MAMRDLWFEPNMTRHVICDASICFGSSAVASAGAEAVGTSLTQRWELRMSQVHHEIFSSPLFEDHWTENSRFCSDLRSRWRYQNGRLTPFTLQINEIAFPFIFVYFCHIWHDKQVKRIRQPIVHHQAALRTGTYNSTKSQLTERTQVRLGLSLNFHSVIVPTRTRRTLRQLHEILLHWLHNKYFMHCSQAHAYRHVIHSSVLSSGSL